MGRLNIVSFVLPLCIVLSPPATGSEKAKSRNTATGWFSCSRCAAARVKAGHIRPAHANCARKCIARSGMVFIEAKTCTIYRVRKRDAAMGHEDEYVRMRGTIDPTAKAVDVTSVDVLKQSVTACPYLN